MLAPLSTLPQSTSASQIDPVFAVIERHKQALNAWFPKLDAVCRMHLEDPGFEAANRLSHSCDDVADEVEHEFLGLVPTTWAGVFALLKHIDDINRGEVGSLQPHGGCRTCYLQWPDDAYTDGETKTADGSLLEQEWPFWVMRNIRVALENLRKEEAAA